MISWISDNLGTILISLILLAMVAGIIWSMRRDKKRGKSSCAGNCSHCAMGCSCHPAPPAEKKTLKKSKT